MSSVRSLAESPIRTEGTIRACAVEVPTRPAARVGKSRHLSEEPVNFAPSPARVNSEDVSRPGARTVRD